MVWDPCLTTDPPTAAPPTTQVADRFMVDTLDLHFHLRLLLDLRADDGIHWLPMAVRLCTNLLLGHIALSWGKPLPNRSAHAPLPTGGAPGTNLRPVRLPRPHKRSLDFGRLL